MSHSTRVLSLSSSGRGATAGEKRGKDIFWGVLGSNPAGIWHGALKINLFLKSFLCWNNWRRLSWRKGLRSLCVQYWYDCIFFCLDSLISWSGSCFLWLIPVNIMERDLSHTAAKHCTTFHLTLLCSTELHISQSFSRGKRDWSFPPSIFSTSKECSVVYFSSLFYFCLLVHFKHFWLYFWRCVFRKICSFGWTWTEAASQ